MSTIEMPQKIVVEKNIVNIAGILADMNLGRKALVVCDENVIDIGKKLSAAAGANLAKLKSSGMKTIESMASVIKVYDSLIAVGGGKTIDAVKYAAYLAKKPWVSFPTILSHDGIVSSRAIINDNGVKTSLDAKEPVAIVADLEILANSPYKFTAAGAGDCISNITALEDWRIADRAGKEDYDEFIADIAMLSAKAVIKNADKIKNRGDKGMEILLWSLLCSGLAMNMHCSSRPASGSEHNFSHALDALNSNALHGEQVALGAMIMAYLQEEKGFMKKRPAFTWENIANVMEKLGLPMTAEQIGIENDKLIQAIVNAKNVRDRYTVLNEKNLTEKEAEKILKTLGII
ncbi:MAG: iron-containing alcohol dehydrogenase [Candidatus Aenigmarchaeota archaeon]|nr:iron-containing alcohol dehydrogenase [Candidatus Aenigmarchaeota archaeon]